MSKVKLERISSHIIKELSQILHDEARNEVLKSVTLTATEVSADLSVAKIYYTYYGDYDKEFIANELKNASSFLRIELAERIEIRHTPELRFEFDESIEYGTNIEKILNEINNEESNKKGE